MSAPDYYACLKLDRDATTADIKKAFRNLAKRYHPDKNPEPAAARRFRRIWRAYNVLRDAKQKRAYDKTLLAAEGAVANHAYGASRHPHAAEPAVKTVDRLFQALLQHHYETGIALYEQLLQHFEKKGHKKGQGVTLDAVLSYEESRDCEFLVAEAYEKVWVEKRACSEDVGIAEDRPPRYYCERAMAMYESLLAAETQRPCFRHFTREVKDRLKMLYLACYKDCTARNDNAVLLGKVQALHLPKRETAWIYKKIAECYVEINQLPEAREVLQLAFEIHPRLAGAKKICETLNIVQPV